MRTNDNRNKDYKTINAVAMNCVAFALHDLEDVDGCVRKWLAK